MNPNEVAAALNKIAEGIAELSIAVLAATPQLEQTALIEHYDAEPFEVEQAPPRVAARVAAEQRKPVPKPVDKTRCPAHGGLWLRGRYGPYCSSKSDEPAWSNEKGFCTITPDTADVYVEAALPF